MGKRIKKGLIYKEVNSLDKEIFTLVFKLGTLREFLGGRYGRTWGFYEWLSKTNQAPKLDYYRPSLHDKYITSVKERLTATLGESYVNEKGSWNISREADDRTRTKISAMQKNLDELERKRGKLLSSWYNARGRKNRKLIIASIGHKIFEGSEERVKDFMYCTSTGREVTIDLTMKKQAQKYYQTENVVPDTFSDIPILKMKGFMFDSHFTKLKHGNKAVGYANPTTKLGVIAAANKAGASDDVIEAAKKLREQMNDSIFCTYIDSKARSSFKTKEIFLFVGQKKIDKQELRKKYRGEDRLGKERDERRRIEREAEKERELKRTKEIEEQQRNMVATYEEM